MGGRLARHTGAPCGSRRRCTRRTRGWRGLRLSLSCQGRGGVLHRRVRDLGIRVSIDSAVWISRYTFCECAASDMVNLRVASGILAEFCAPGHHLTDELLLCGLVGWECAEQRQQLASAACIGLGLALIEDIDQEDAKVAAGAALASLQEGLRAAEEDIGRRRPVGGFGVARCDYAQLLVGFIVLALGDSRCVSGGGSASGRDPTSPSAAESSSRS